MLLIRPMIESDLPAALRLSTQAGWNQIGADWLRLLRLAPHQCLAGCIQNQLIATATLATYGDRLGWVGMILVDQAYRGHGHGTTMFDAILSLAERLGIPTLGLDATELGQSLYCKRRFLPYAPINRWVGHAQPDAHPAGSCTSPATTDWPDILALDRRQTGLDRSSLLRLMANEPRATIRMLRESHQLVAFALARPGRTAAQIGPVIAQSPDAAALVIDSLLHELVHTATSCPILMDIPGGSPLEVVIATRGFAIKRRLTRMFRPCAPADFLPPSAIAAATSFALG